MKNTFVKILLILTIMSSLVLCVLLFLLVRKGSGDERPVSMLKDYQQKYLETGQDQKTITPMIYMDFQTAGGGDLYDSSRHEEAYERLEALKSSSTYSQDEPLLIYNPYGVNSLSLYVYFETEHPAKTTYRISAASGGMPVFSGDCPSEQEFSRKHEYLLIGLTANCSNRISLSTVDGAGNTCVRTFYLNCPAMSSEWKQQLSLSRGLSEEPQGEGLYTVIGNTVNGKEAVLFYDKDGVLRSELALDDTGCCRVLMLSEGMFLNSSEHEFIMVDRFGHMGKRYEVNGYRIENDFVWNEKKDEILFAASKVGEGEAAKGVTDRLVSLSLATGEVTELLDMGTLLPEYKELCDKDEEGRLNWFALHSIAMLNEDSVLLLSREMSSAVKITDIYEKPVLSYIIGDELLLADTGYDFDLLTKSGTFPSFFGASDMQCERDETMPKEAYYLTVFDNHIGGTKSRPDVDYAEIENDLGTSLKKGTSSYYLRFLVNEKERTWELMESIPVAYTGYYGNAERTEEGNLLSVCAGRLSFTEYDKQNQAIGTFTTTGDGSLRRVDKIVLRGFWFFDELKAKSTTGEELQE